MCRNEQKVGAEPEQAELVQGKQWVTVGPNWKPPGVLWIALSWKMLNLLLSEALESVCCCARADVRKIFKFKYLAFAVDPDAVLLVLSCFLCYMPSAGEAPAPETTVVMPRSAGVRRGAQCRKWHGPTVWWGAKGRPRCHQPERWQGRAR